MNSKIDIKQVWNNALKTIEENTLDTTFSLWVAPLIPHYFQDNTFILRTAHSFAPQFLAKPEIAKVIKEALTKEFGNEVNFKITFDEDLSKQIKKNVPKQIKNEQDSVSKYDHLKQMQSDCNLNLKFKFENFVVGANNQFAFNTAMSIAKQPIDNQYNPLFIYGNSGLGKTHLMQAIGHYIMFNHPTLKVRYQKANNLFIDIVNALSVGMNKTEKINKVRQKFKNIDVLLLDDIQFIAGKEMTEGEIFNIFESFHLAGKQVIITSDKTPKEIPKLSDRLKTRFEWGLMVEMQAPDTETRVAILQKLADGANIIIPFEIIEFIAQIHSNNIRELEGAFNTVKAHVELNNLKDFGLENIKRILNYKENVKNITPSYILDILSEYFNVSEKELLGSSRTKNLKYVRQIAIYLIRKITKLSLPDIGKFFSKNHTTILYSYNKIEEEITSDIKLRKLTAELSDLIRKN